MDGRSGGGNGLGGPGVLHAGLSWWNGWSLGGQRPGCLNATPCRGPWLGGPQMLHAWGVLASPLELNWVQAFGLPVCASLGSCWGYGWG